MSSHCRIQLLGTFAVHCGENSLTRFRRHATGLLLAYLAYFHPQPQPRERLIEILWPDLASDLGRNRFYPELSWLRRHLEPEPIPPGTVLLANRLTVRLHPETVTTDVIEFLAALRAAERAASLSERRAGLEKAVALYTGELLPGYYEDWILTERERLEGQYRNALRQYAAAWAESGELEPAIEYAQRALRLDPLQEEIHSDLMRYYAAMGQPSAVLRQYQEWERRLWEELGEKPSEAMNVLVETLREQARRAAGAQKSVRVGGDSALSSATVSGLPAPLTRFFGREAEIERLVEMLSPVSETPARLVTLTGMGGAGKTRLAIEAARRLAEAYAGAAWFVSLADVREARFLPSAILDAMGRSRQPNVEPMEQVIQSLPIAPGLLALDNFEQLIEEGALMLSSLLSRVPALTLLVTSRQRLHLAGERLWPVGALPVPATADIGEGLLEFASVSLFVDRVQAAQPDFALTSANSATIVALCQRLEGIPLALELAASWATVLSLPQMVASLESRFAFLTTEQRDIAARHKTLWAALEGSYQLLSPDLQRFFAHLSVFRGGWTAEAAEAVCETPRALPHLSQLCDVSLLGAEESGTAKRYRCLETVREFAEEQLAPEERAETERKHADYFLTFAESVEPELEGKAQQAGFDKLGWERENFRLALYWFLKNDASGGLRLAGALGRFWYIRANLREGLEFLTAFLVQPGNALPSAARAKALAAAGALSWPQGDYAKAGAFYEESLQIYREVGDLRGVAFMLNHLGAQAHLQADYAKATKLCEESLELFRQQDDKRGIAAARSNMGYVARDSGDTMAARQHHEESLRLRRELEDTEGIASSLGYLGMLAGQRQDYASAYALHAESLEMFRSLGDKRGMGSALNYQGLAAFHLGAEETAFRLLAEGKAILQEIGAKRGVAFSLNNLAKLFLAKERYAEGAACYRESLALWRSIEDWPQVVSVLGILGGLAAAQGQPQQAGRLQGAAEAIHRFVGLPGPLPDHVFQHPHLAAARAELGEDAFAAAQEAGRALSLDQAVALALREGDA